MFYCDNVRVEVGPRDSRTTVIDGLTTEIGTGEFLCVLGPSGVGKTTLLRVLGGLHKPAQGSTVTMAGKRVEGCPEGAIFLFQDYAASLLPWRSALRNVELGLEGQRLSRSERRSIAMSALDSVGLAERWRDHPRQFSGGMQQRLQIARALAVSPDVLLMDEPFGALDAMTREGLQLQLRQIYTEFRKTIVFVTHDIDEATLLSTRIIVLNGQPANIVLDEANPLGESRDPITTKEAPAYLELRRRVYEAVRGNGG